ncbi:MAG: hypothetical protein EOO73_17095 [Myxococcales bacterium]|nr:MAG: hypothetical protein EOO73_17095 [Myxococcales bacterium]
MNGAGLPNLIQLQAGDHYCGIYRTDEDYRSVLVDFVRQGVTRHEKLFYIVNLQSASQLKETLATAGVDVEQLAARGQLVIMTAKEAYLKEGLFDPDKMVTLLREETNKALAEGYTALGVTGDMTWALAGEPGSERLVEYEAKLNAFFPTSRCYGICQYDHRRFDPEILVDVLHTHPKVICGQGAYDNADMYYVPPEQFLKDDRQSAILDQWLHNLARRPASP